MGVLNYWMYIQHITMCKVTCTYSAIWKFVIFLHRMQLLYERIEKSEQKHMNQWKATIKSNKTFPLTTHNTAKYVCIYIWIMCTCDTKHCTYIDCLLQKLQYLIIGYSASKQILTHHCKRVCVRAVRPCEYVLIVLNCCILDPHIWEMFHQ